MMKINELADALPRTVENFNELNGTNITFNFEKSKYNLLIQLSDFLLEAYQ